MMRKGIYSIVFIVIFVGIFFMVDFSSEKLSKEICNSYSIAVIDSAKYSFVKRQELENIIKEEKKYIVGNKVEDIDYSSIEDLLGSHSLIKDVECYPCPSGKLNIDVWQKKPILRVFSNGVSFYIDDKGERTSLSKYSTANVIVASGNVNDSITLRRLFDLAKYIDEDVFAKSMYEQIYVDVNGDFELVTRVGCQKVILGFPCNIVEKMDRLKNFYKKYLNDIGWQRYSVISLKFDNQIVCTLKNVLK